MFFADRVVVAVVADGAGGTSGGAEAATLVVERVEQAIAEGRAPLRAETWQQVLLEAGIELETRSIGQTTAVVVATGGGPVFGASVGDSAAWLFGPNGCLELTDGQERKPLLGGGLPRPLAISGQLGRHDSLLLGTDGLFKYARLDRIADALAERDAGACCEALLALPQTRAGTLQDDVGVVVVRFDLAAVRSAVAAAATALKNATDAEADAAARRFNAALEAWIASLLPDEEPWVRCPFDGLVCELRFGDDEAVDAHGGIYEIESQRLFPFEVHLTIGEQDVIAYSVAFGDRDTPQGTSPTGGNRRSRPSAWLFRFDSP